LKIPTTIGDEMNQDFLVCEFIEDTIGLKEHLPKFAFEICGQLNWP